MGNPLETEGPCPEKPAAHQVYYTSRHCHLYLRAFSDPCVGGCGSVNGDAENVEGVVYVEQTESAERFGSAESVRINARCDENVGSAGVEHRGPLFHS